jgi:hypothetical protein
MTYSFIKAVESEPGTTYGRLLNAMRATIRDNGGDSGIPGPIGSFFRRVITFSCAQVLDLLTRSSHLILATQTCEDTSVTSVGRFCRNLNYVRQKHLTSTRSRLCCS